MRRFFLMPGAVVLLAMLSSCVTPSVATVGSAVQLGLQVAKTISKATKEHPADAGARIRFYAEFYCGIRESNAPEWSEIRTVAIKAGAPEHLVNLVKLTIDKTCPVGPIAGAPKSGRPGYKA